MSRYRKAKSKRIKEKLSPIPHNNRPENGHRSVRKQLIIFYKADENGNPVLIRKTVYHANLSISEQRRIHDIKVAIDTGDANILQKLNPRERKMYDNMLKLKRENEGKNDNQS